MAEPETRASNDVTKASPAEKQTPLPRKEIAIISVLLVGTGCFYSSLSMLLVYMVQSYDIAANPEELGKYTGWMAASYFLGQLCTSLFWGWLSDRTGRKPWLITAEIVAAIAALMLAFCQDYYLACAVLFVHGFFHCTLVISKSTIAELCDKTNQSLAFGVVLVTIGAGSTLGPLVGGVLAQPCQKGYIKECSPFLQSHPFLFPFLIFATLNIISTICTFFLRETNPQGKRAMQRAVPEVDEEEGALSGAAADLLSADKDGGSLDKPLLKKHEVPQTDNPVRDVILSSVLFGLVYFIYLYGDVLFSIFAASPPVVNGLGYDSTVMGVLASLYGVTMALYTLFLFPKVAKRLGPLRSVLLCLSIYIFVWPLGPLVAFIHGHPVIQFLCALLFKMVRVVCGCTAGTASMMMVSNAAGSAKQGFVAGLSTTAGSLLGTPAPALAGLLWAAFAHNSFPFHQFMPWLLPSVAALLGVIVASFLSPATNAPQNSSAKGMSR